MSDRSLIAIALEWASAARMVRAAQAEYTRASGAVGERLTFLDNHPEHRRSTDEITRDIVLMADQRKAGDAVMEADRRASILLNDLQLAADAALPREDDHV